ncbi:MAG: DNA polymerase III subunit delta [Burkholderiaceae bacterium]|nr:MAG: DNA polymerase III subunit delta [Burkholderiaceae bacterium]
MGHRLDPDKLQNRLEQTPPALDPLYVVMGDEPLLVIETSDSLRAAATRAGYLERTSLVMDARSDWSAVIASTQNISLFGDKRLVEVRIPTGKPGKTGGETLAKLAQLTQENTLDDTLVVIGLPRLDKATRSSKWASALLAAATLVELPTIERTQLPRWIQQRLARQKQKLDPASLEWMADKVEGNLLAAFQEIQKLALLYPEGALSVKDVEQAVLNVARYDVFDLRDAMLTGNTARALAVLDGLRAEGEALPLVLWAVGDEIRVMARLAADAAAGRDLSTSMRQQRIFGAREQQIRQTLKRTPAKTWPAAVQHAHDVDRLIKGLKVPGRLDDPWEELARLTLRIASGRANRTH